VSQSTVGAASEFRSAARSHFFSGPSKAVSPPGHAQAPAPESLHLPTNLSEFLTPGFRFGIFRNVGCFRFIGISACLG
jgi:hypothetical protein